MNWDDFAGWSKHIADWGAQYHKTLRERPVRAQTKPGEIVAQLPASPPQQPEDMAAIMADFEAIVMPGMTHWQHPRFFAYFPANAAPASRLGAQFDCSVQFLADATPQLNTLKIEPEYLKTTGKAVTNYSEWTIPLGRRFRALKLWFLIRSYGLEGLQTRIRNHVAWAGELCDAIRTLEGFEIVTEPILSLFSFRCPGDDDMQQRMVDAINDDGRIYLTQGAFQGRKIIRFQVGQFDTTRDDVMMAHQIIQEIRKEIQ